MNFIDFHCHLNLQPFLTDIDTYIKELIDNNTQVIVVGVDMETSKKAVELCKKFPHTCIGATIGQHPNDNPKEKFDLEKYRDLAKEKEVVGVGECGLDYFRLSGTQDEIATEKKRQVILFQKHIELASQTKKMLMIHARPSKGSMDAYNDAIEILEKQNFTGKVNFHFFVGDLSVTQKIVAHGWNVSFDGPITFTNEYDRVIDFVPLGNIGCETDAPFAAPVPYRGQVCKPWMVKEIYAKIAEIKKMSVDQVNRQIHINAQNLFDSGM